jgi:GNAT superfamily N-acetyltransferase
MGIRLAESADRAAVEAIVQAAYEPWVAVIGVRPLPLVADYGELIAQGHVHVLENGEIDALIVLEVTDGVLLVENVAVRPDRQGRGLGRRLMAFAEFRARSLGRTRGQKRPVRRAHAQETVAAVKGGTIGRGAAFNLKFKDERSRVSASPNAAVAFRHPRGCRIPVRGGG